MDYKKIDFTTILGKTDKNGHWLDVEEKKENIDEQPSSTIANGDSMYLFEGVDYRDMAQKDDIEFFDRLILNEEETKSEKVTSERPQRRQMTEEEKASRTAKMLETKARRKQELVMGKYF